MISNFIILSIYMIKHIYIDKKNLNIQYKLIHSPGIEELNTNSIVNIINSNGNKYVFNNKTVYIDKYYLSNGSYTLKNIPQSHPIALLNNNNSNISYSISNSDTPIIINISGGNISSYSSGDYYIFKDSNNNLINIKNGDYKFMIGKTYEFIDNGISSLHPFKINNQTINYYTKSLKITINQNTTYTYKCDIHPNMNGTLSLYNKDVTNTTNDGNYNFYYGDVNIDVKGDFNKMSVYCIHHGYMGGENIFSYKSNNSY